MSKKAAFGFWYVLMALWGIAILHTLTKQPSEKVEQIPYSQFEAYLDEGRIEEVRVASSYIEGTLKNPPQGHTKQFLTFRVEPELANKLAAHQVKFAGEVENTAFHDLLSWTLPTVLFFGIWIFLMRRAANKQGMGGGFLAIGKRGKNLHGKGRPGDVN